MVESLQGRNICDLHGDARIEQPKRQKKTYANVNNVPTLVGLERRLSIRRKRQDLCPERWDHYQIMFLRLI